MGCRIKHIRVDLNKEAFCNRFIDQRAADGNFQIPLFRNIYIAIFVKCRDPISIKAGLIIDVIFLKTDHLSLEPGAFRKHAGNLDLCFFRIVLYFQGMTGHMLPGDACPIPQASLKGGSLQFLMRRNRLQYLIGQLLFITGRRKFRIRFRCIGD